MIAPYSLISELEEAISHGSAERRVETLWRVTDLFIAGSVHLTEDQIALFGDVIHRLAGTIEVSAQAALASRLATVPNVPRVVIHDLAFHDAISVAGPILTFSECLDEAALVDNARTKSQQHLLAISRRGCSPRP